MIRGLLLVIAATTLAGCQCGPGVACKSDAVCGDWGHCEGGYCVVNGPMPVATLSADHLDFGLVGCGATALTLPFGLTNDGAAPLGFTASVGDSTAFAVDTGSGMIPVGRSVSLVVSARVASSASAGAAQQGVLTLTTTDPKRPSASVPLTLTAAGVALTLVPSSAIFGLVSVNTAAPDLPLELKNTGNVAATVGLDAPGDPQFTLSWTGAPTSVTVGPGQPVPALVARFTPTRITPSTTSAAIHVAEAICGSSVASISFSGEGSNGRPGFSQTELFFGNNGLVDCGADAGVQTFTLTNTGNRSFSWSGSLSRGAASPFSVSPLGGTVLATTGSVTVTVSTAGIPAQASTAADGFGDTLSIVTDVANDTSHPITLHQTARGAVLSFSTATLDFGLVPVANTASAPFSVVNGGNAPAQLSLASNSLKFSASPAGPTPILGGASLAATGFFSPDGGATSELATLTALAAAGDVLCGPLPMPITMRGTGTTGAVSYGPAALDFGSVNCGASAAAKTVTFSNAGNQSYTVTPSLGKGPDSGFTLSMSPDSGVVAQDGGVVVITVTPRPIPQTSEVTPNLYGDTLSVSTDVGQDPPHTIPLLETARGAIFGVSATSIDFGTVAVGQTQSSQFTIDNSGNVSGTLSLTPAQPQIFTLPQNVVVNANTPSIQTGSFSPLAASIYTDAAVLTVSASTVLCKPLPLSALPLKGTGTNSSVVMVSASSLTFGSGGLVPCGTTASGQMVAVTNNSSQALTLTLSLAGGSARFTASGPPSVAVGATAMISITPVAVPSSTSTAPDALADSLSIRAAGGLVDETHVVALHETAQGAILTLNPGSLAFGGASGTQGFTVNNTGNLNAPYTLTLTGSSSFSVSPTSSSVGSGSSTSESASYTHVLLSGNKSASVKLGTTVTRCAPLPADLTMTGN